MPCSLEAPIDRAAVLAPAMAPEIVLVVPLPVAIVAGPERVMLPVRVVLPIRMADS